VKKSVTIFAALTLLSLIGCKRHRTLSGVIISARIDQFGFHHIGSTGTSRSATITCIQAGGMPGVPASCIIIAPGYEGTVNTGGVVTGSGPGPVSLDCSGSAGVECTAIVN
jgi:hypothetical protein